MHYVLETGEFCYNPPDLKLFEPTRVEERYLQQARRHVEAMLAIQDAREAEEVLERGPKGYEPLPPVPTLPPLGEKYKWKMGAWLLEIQREQVVRVLEDNRGEFAFSLEEMSE